MTEADQAKNYFTPVEVDLKDPVVAALLAWFLPGAGHLYQGRHAKGILYMACILTTFFFGLTSCFRRS